MYKKFIFGYNNKFLDKRFLFLTDKISYLFFILSPNYIITIFSKIIQIFHFYFGALGFGTTSQLHDINRHSISKIYLKLCYRLSPILIW